MIIDSCFLFPFLKTQVHWVFSSMIMWALAGSMIVGYWESW